METGLKVTGAGPSRPRARQEAGLGPGAAAAWCIAEHVSPRAKWAYESNFKEEMLSQYVELDYCDVLEVLTCAFLHLVRDFLLVCP